jgi:putative DNA primase/helicase
MSGRAFETILQALEARGCSPLGSNGTRSARCPAHDDRQASLSVTHGTDRVLVHCHAGCEYQQIMEALGLLVGDGFDRDPSQTQETRHQVCAYDYADEQGELLFQAVRFDPKDFRQRRPDGNGGWIWNLKGVRLVPYRLPSVLSAAQAADPIYIVEGEKDVDAVGRAGGVATCNPMGAGNWRHGYAAYFKGAAKVVVVADRDEPGRRHARSVAESLRGVGLTVEVREPAVGKDVADHLGAGRTLDQLIEVQLDQPGPGETPAATPPSDVPSAVAFFDGDKFLPARLGAHLEAETGLALGHDGRLYRYIAGAWRPDGDPWVKSRTRALLGEKFHRAHLEDVLSWCRAAFATIGERPPEAFVNLRNGLLEWRTGELLAHDQGVKSSVQLPVHWQPDATCPGIDRFLAHVLPRDAVEFVIEAIGYAVYPGNPLRRAILLLGPGRNGKSVLLALIKALLGPENVSAIPLQALAEDRFAAAELFGKLANLAGDLDARAVKRSDLFKMVTGGDPILAQRKYGHPFAFTPFALPIFAANEAPISSDQTEAWFDRWVIVPMERRIPDNDIDPHLSAKLTTPEELAGLLVRAVDGLRRLMIRGRFDLPASIAQAGDCYRDRLDTVRAFVSECCIRHPDSWVPRPALYQHYRRWCQDGGRLALSTATFNDHLHRNYGAEVQERTRTGNRGWLGLGLRFAEDGPA